MPVDRLFLRAALHIREVYVSRAAKAAEDLLLAHLNEYQYALQRTREEIRRATASGWSLRALHVRRQLHTLVDAVRNAVAQTVDEHQAMQQAVPDARLLLDELQQLDEEFDGLEVDWRSKCLSVTTEPITLSGVDLGRFKLCLSWRALVNESNAYILDVEALEPNPASSKSAVTHPHVTDSKLCAGDASLAIQRALKQGRLADAFILVRNVLTNYNPHSAHVQLEDWTDSGCERCGQGLDDDESWRCDDCGRTLCSDCASDCAACSGTICVSCLRDCEGCEASYCSSCLQPGVNTDSESCDLLCPSCRSKDEELKPETTSSENSNAMSEPIPATS